ncbi:ABC transporter substrate-binding protein, partial [uncultured Boseongicola sp.]|uniref:ABC transporter substrate-binding protein n=1 Tax=uncultured Boseongicola sp. TaxID=1648499 RepID=UPI002609A720
MKKLMALLLGSLLLAAMPGAALAENELRVASRGDALTLDPYAQAEGPTFNLLNQMYDTLVAFDVDLQLAPVLATSWEVVEPTHWRFYLREGVVFHDGTPFTADDVVFSIERAQQQSSDYRPYVTHIIEVSALDEFTVDVVTDQPMPLLPRDLTNILIMSRAWAEEHNATQVQDFSAGDENYAVRHTNGTGAFILETREQDIQTVMTRNPDWWGIV